MQDTLRSLPQHITETHQLLETDDLLMLVQKLAVAIFIGLLIGMEREHSKPEGEKTFAGVRTYPLISTLGFVAGLISSITSFWVYAFIAAGFIALVVSSHIFSAKEGRHGGTSEISIIIVFLLGSLVFWNFLILAAIIGVVVNLFLTLKFQLHKFVGRINEEDLYATLKLAVITIIVLPLLPDETYGPFDVLNPRMIWLMVIFISGISFAGYIMIKIFGKDKGIPFTGFMGGMVSSTAVTVSLSKKSTENKEASDNLAIGIILASSIMYARVFLVTAVLNRSLMDALWLPMLICTAAGLLTSLILHKRINSNGNNYGVEFKNPFELKSALLFGLIFGAVMFISKAAQVYLGEGGIYTASALAGITSVDAIVISLTKLLGGSFSDKAAVAAIIIATISNNITKAVISFSIGSKEIRKNVIIGLGAVSLVSLVYLIFLLITK